jgi:hypothetical protein
MRLDGSGAETGGETSIKLELHGLTATKLPFESVRKATKMVPTGCTGRVIDCPTFTVPVQLPMLMAEAWKLPARKPVAPCSWLTVLEKFGNTCVGLTPNIAHRFVPELKFPEPFAKGFRMAMLRVLPGCDVPNTKAEVVNVGITLPALQVVYWLMSQRCRLSAFAAELANILNIATAMHIKLFFIMPCTFFLHVSTQLKGTRPHACNPRSKQDAKPIRPTSFCKWLSHMRLSLLHHDLHQPIPA